MNKEMVIKSMDRIEVLLSEAAGLLESIDSAQHLINNARQIAGAVKVLVDE